jgi:hypothetical protein
MARYHHLPIYQLTYELLNRSMLIIKGFPRDYKFTLGQKLQEELIELVVLIYKANSFESERHRYLEQILERVQVVELLIRLCQDLRVMSKKHYAALAEMVVSISRQASGWKKSVKK